MKKILIATAIATSVAGGALAGSVDVIVASEPVVIAPVQKITDWSGPYVGALVGFGSGTADEIWDDGQETTTDTYDLEGIGYGAFAGYNFQSGSIVYGIEAAFQFSDVGFLVEDVFVLGGDLVADYQGGFTNFTDLKARVGFAAGNALIYGFAGGSMGSYSTEYVGLGDVWNVSAAGYNYGAGVNLFVTNSIFVGAEYIVRELTGDMDEDADWSLDATVEAVEVRVGMQF